MREIMFPSAQVVRLFASIRAVLNSHSLHSILSSLDGRRSPTEAKAWLVEHQCERFSQRRTCTLIWLRPLMA